MVAPDPQLRRSITFLLEAEGYAVTPSCALPHAAEEIAAAAPADGCAVVDEAAVTDASDFWDRLAHLACAVVMLSSGRLAPPPHFLVHSVEKPMLGRHLVEAVQAAFRGREGDGG